jgi:hypothetical protein
MAAYSDTIENDVNAEATVQLQQWRPTVTIQESAAVQSALLREQWVAKATVVNDVWGEGAWFQYDEPVSDANAQAALVNERRDLLALVVAAGRGEATVPLQVRHRVAEVLEPAAGGEAPILAAYRALYDTVQEDAGGDGLTVSQRLAVAAPLLEGVAAATEALVTAALRASVTLEESASGDAGESPVFWEDAYGEASAPRARLHASYTAVADASAEASILSEALASLFKDTVTADANAAASVRSQQLQAVQTIINDMEAVEELLNVVSDEAWVFNAWTLAFSRYTGIEVTDAADAGGQPLFAGPSGVYRFSSTSYVDALVRFGLTNLGSMAPKRLRAVYVSTMGRGVVKLATFHGSGGSLVQHNYATPERDSATPINRRISPARGHTGQHWGLQVETTGGDRQTVTRIHVIPLVTGRKL